MRATPGSPPSPAGLAESVALRVLDSVTVGRLDLTLPDGTSRRFAGNRPGPSASVSVRSADAFRRLLWRPNISIGEGYVAGDWTSPDLVAVLELAIRNVEEARLRPPLSWLDAVGRHRPPLAPAQNERRARRDIHYHYDLGNDFFRLFLDESLTYSCAYFESEAATLEEAQRAKYRRLAEKLELTPDDHVLEIGCGWGGFALFAASEYGCRVTGLTISEQQLALARERVREAGLDSLVEIRLEDYRRTSGRFTKIASIEMLEAIGHSQFPTFFATCDRLLERDGLACIQTIAMPDQRYERYRRRNDWIREYIFPGALLPSVTALATAMTRSSSLMILGLEEIGIHYAATLREWRRRFWAHIDDVRALGADERFVRTWDFYLAYCEAAFATRSLRDVHLLLGRPLNDSLRPYPTRRPTH